MSSEKPLILVVDDEPDIRDVIRDILEDELYRVVTASNGVEAREAFDQHQPSLVLLDIWMPDVDGISLLKAFKQQRSSVTVLMMSGHGTIETAVEATRAGATDFIEKPLSMAKLLRGVELAIEHQAKQAAQQRLQHQPPAGKSAVMRHLREQVEKVAKHPVPILLCGERGSGKHCFAHYLHGQGAYANGKFIELTPESFPPDSVKLRQLIAQSCVFINDVDQLTAPAQNLLLHFLDSGQLEACQLICATEQPLELAVERGGFLDSLYYQLSTVTLTIPALRDHIEDLPDLLHHFVDEETTQAGLPYRKFTVAAQNRLRNFSWPGNVLELKHFIKRMLMLSEHEMVDLPEVDHALSEMADPADRHTGGLDFDLPLREAREQFERLYLLKKLEETHGNVGRAAQLSGMERTHLYRKLRALGIDTKATQD